MGLLGEGTAATIRTPINFESTHKGRLKGRVTEPSIGCLRECLGPCSTVPPVVSIAGERGGGGHHDCADCLVAKPVMAV